MRTKLGRHNHPAKLKREALKRAVEQKKTLVDEYMDPVEKFVKEAAGLLDSPVVHYYGWRRRQKLPEPAFRRDPIPRGYVYSPPKLTHIDGIEAATDKLIPLDKSEFGRYLPLTTLSYRLVECYKIKRDSTRFHQLAVRLAEPNIRLVYHGTRGESIIGITNMGLCQGRHGMFGGGIYLAPNIEKAAACGRYVIACKAILGNQKEMETPGHVDGEQLWAEGYQSVWGMHDKTASWGGKLTWDEYVVYFRDQVLPMAIGRYELLPAPKVVSK